jgi:hypothetical protein
MNTIPILSTYAAMSPAIQVSPIISARRAYRWKFVLVLVELLKSDLVMWMRHALQMKKAALTTMTTNRGPTVKIRIATELLM